MTPAEIGNIIIALVAIGTFWLSARSTSYTELKALFDTLKDDFKKYKKESEEEFVKYKTERDLEKERLEKHIIMLQENNEKKDKEIEALEDINKTLINQGDNYKRYITRLIRQLENAQIIPEKFDGD